MFLDDKMTVTLLGISGIAALTALGITAIICGSNNENDKERERLLSKEQVLNEREKKLQEAYEKKHLTDEKIKSEKDKLDQREANIQLKIMEMEKIKDSIEDMFREYKKIKE